MIKLENILKQLSIQGFLWGMGQSENKIIVI